MKCERAKVAVRGVVQGVGFRPFVYRLAAQLNLFGWVLNSSQGVFIEVEGTREELQSFLVRLEREKPARAAIQSLEFSFLEPVGYHRFEIRYSESTGQKSVLILPDVAVCDDCLREMFDPMNRRYRYPFINCTNCGPRFSIIESLPYDRPNTSMKRFSMCRACRREYQDPGDRRFHAQPNACPDCGPRLQLWDADGIGLAYGEEALLRTVELVRKGNIVALKGIGGFQLIVDARDGSAIQRLRDRKCREQKPFALMYPSLDHARQDCAISDLEARLLSAPEAPIVLLSRKPGNSVLAPQIAPFSSNLGVMIPYSPLHHLLLRDLGIPVVATSANLSDEPICIDEYEGLKRLHGIADCFLIHDRPIVRHVDDSVARVVSGREMILRRARGYAPLPIHVNNALPCVLAVGAHLKNCVALSVGHEIFISQHIGDLETSAAFSAFRRTIEDLPRLYEAQPSAIACDMHPEYLSTKHAARARSHVHKIQHHYAHVLACMAENELRDTVLGIAWDGTGYGTDGTIWGGEFLLSDETSYRRVAHFRQFRLPGSNAAVKEPRRTALGVLYEIWGDSVLVDRRLRPVAAFTGSELVIIRRMLSKGLNAPVTSSAGRLFDAVASILGLRQRTTFEGQAAMQLEYALEPGVDEFYSFEISEQTTQIVDWAPMIAEILIDLQKGQTCGQISAKFHNTLAEIIVAVARRLGEQRVVLTGGCFQNRYLVERSVDRLREAGFKPYWHQRIPPNDGGIALGQVIAAAARGVTTAVTEGVAAL
ncbi:MAG TPA: carbamoyltransferase HypF [Chthoniobacterales bacterium]|nr:carbamoyltransferase HypF [Chthoniobacterales bacterium]